MPIDESKTVRMFVKPNPERRVQVRDPQSKRLLKTGGEWKPRNAYWMRRLRDDDIVQAKPPAAAPPAKKAAKKKAPKKKAAVKSASTGSVH